MSLTPPQMLRAPPLLGQHTDEVLAELGLSPAQREALSAAGVTGAGGVQADVKN
jgi:formyl-CoA transferase